MKRRGFLQALAGGVAAITGVSSFAVKSEDIPIDLPLKRRPRGIEPEYGLGTFPLNKSEVVSGDATSTGQKFVVYRAETMFSGWRAS